MLVCKILTGKQVWNESQKEHVAAVRSNVGHVRGEVAAREFRKQNNAAAGDEVDAADDAR